MKIAYLANQFPCAVEPYVMEEIAELRASGLEVIACSARGPRELPPQLVDWNKETLYLLRPRYLAALRATMTCFWLRHELRPFLHRILGGREALSQRIKALFHTWLGVYYAVLLQNANVQHIHVHHGYFSAWIAMIAAQVLAISYSITLHGSDVLLNAAYLDIKLERCLVCFTVSEYNRSYILQHYPQVPAGKVVLRRLGVEVPEIAAHDCCQPDRDRSFVVLAVGRLHPVKDHAFLVRACALLKAHGLEFACFIAGEGQERERLEHQISAAGLQQEVKLLGHVSHEELEAIYPLAHLVVLTSKSEGIPLALMEAMSYGRPVLAPNITGIPELVMDGKSGYLYTPGSLEDFVERVERVYSAGETVNSLTRAAHAHVKANFNRSLNLQRFVSELTSRIPHQYSHAHPVLQ